MTVAPLGKSPVVPETPFNSLMRRAPAAANTNGKLTLVSSVTRDPTMLASERFALRGLFANSILLVGVGGLIETQPLSIATQGRAFDEEFLAEFDEVARLAAETSALQIQIEHYKLLGLSVLIPILQNRLDYLRMQFYTVAQGYGTPIVASAGDGGSISTHSRTTRSTDDEDLLSPAKKNALYRLRLDEWCEQIGHPVPKSFGHEVDPDTIGRRIALDATPAERLAIWCMIQSVVEDHLSVHQKAYALNLVLGFLHDDFSPLSVGDREGLRNVVLAGFKDRDAGIVAYAWQIAELGKVIDPASVTRDMFTWPEATANPQFQLSHFVRFQSQQEGMGWLSFLSYLREDRFLHTTTLPLASVEPVHSPSYYTPGWHALDHIRGRMKSDLKNLQQLAAATPSDADFTMTLSQFLIEFGMSSDLPYVFELKSGRRLLVDGQSRAAVLLTAEREGLVPEAWRQAGWLNRIPVRLERYNGNIPEVVILRVLALGQTLTWGEYLSPLVSSFSDPEIN